jgi:hypothetical protein
MLVIIPDTRDHKVKEQKKYNNNNNNNNNNNWSRRMRWRITITEDE